MHIVLSQDEMIKLIRLCLSDATLLTMSRLGVIIDYPTKDYADTREAMFATSQTDVILQMLRDGKRVSFIDYDGVTNCQYDLRFEQVNERIKGVEATTAVSNLLQSGYNEKDALIALQYLLYKRYKYPVIY